MKSLEFINDDCILGVGTGSTVNHLIEALPSVKNKIEAVTSSSEASTKLLEENGFRVTRGVAEIPTAFVAEFGSGKPVIGILGEFDANPGISQKKQPTKDPLVKGAAGHGCGHNLYGTGSLGAAIAIKEMIESG